MKAVKKRLRMKKLISLILAFVFLARFAPTFVPTAAAAEDETRNTPEIYFEPSNTSLLPSDRDVIEGYTDKTFEPDSDDFKVSYGLFNGRTGMSVRRDEGTGPLSVSLTKEYDEPIDLSKYNELFFRIYADISSKSAVDISVTLYSGYTSYTAEGSLIPDAIYDVYCPIDLFESRGSVTAVAISIKAERNAAVTISAILADERFSYSHIRLFSADTFSSDGALEIGRDKIDIAIDESAAWIAASSEFLTKNSGNGGSLIARVMLSGAENGTVTFSVKKNRDAEYTDVATITLYQGLNPYVFVFDGSKECDSYKITLSGVTPTEGLTVSLHSVGIEHFDDAVREDASAYPGSITSCSLTSDGKNVRINGTVRSETVVNSINAKLGVFAVDILTDETTDVLGSVNMTTVFQMNISTSSLSGNPSLYKYFAAIVEDDGITPVTSYAYPSVAASAISTGPSVLGLKDSDTSSHFRANVSHTVVDVYLDRLISSDDSGRIYTYGDSFLYLDNSYISELDSSINFQITTGANVYLRLISASPMSDAPNINSALLYSFDSGDQIAAQKYMSAVDFLSSRYEKVSGVIVGKSVNCFLYNRLAGRDGLIEYAENYVNILRLTAVVIRQNSSEASLIVPIGDLNEMGGAGTLSITGIGEEGAAPDVFAAVISHIIAKNGGFQWYMMYECEDEPVSAMTYAYTLANQLTQGLGTSPRGHMVFWEPKSEISESDIKEFALAASDAAVTFSTSAAILSVTEQRSAGLDVCETLSAIVSDTNPDRKIVSANAYTAGTSGAVGQVFLRDFRNSYSTEGFIFGGSASSLSTENLQSFSEYENMENCRGLRCSVTPSPGGTAVLFCPLDTAVNLSCASYVDLTLCIEAESAEDMAVKIIFGKGVNRFEFHADVTPGAPVTLRCPTESENIDFDIEYMAITVQTDENIFLDVSKIAASSFTMTSGELSAALNRETAENGDSSETSLTLILVLSACITVAVFVLLSMFPEPTGRKSKAASRKTQNKD